ncbi:hypothetical protein [Thermosulfurimonas dismutans]|uniref:Uncharacterized protein n=1 Tax=Thermosulfurimonas dismutans TaxID=999894 RepID=A0A179D3F1_9BACT|nr:hypothetical protein [Thermosulfurimonas dismutans]OAQ20331.1 hypothetical protein TDIS_1526 [Thermosulfurimonas dismutans]
MTQAVNMKEHFPFDLLAMDLSDEALKVEELGHALETLTYLSRLVYSLSQGQGFKDLDVKDWGEQALMGLGSLFEVLAQYAFDRKENLSKTLESLKRSHQEELILAKEEAVRELAKKKAPSSEEA